MSSAICDFSTIRLSEGPGSNVRCGGLYLVGGPSLGKRKNVTVASKAEAKPQNISLKQLLRLLKTSHPWPDAAKITRDHGLREQQFFSGAMHSKSPAKAEDGRHLRAELVWDGPCPAGTPRLCPRSIQKSPQARTGAGPRSLCSAEAPVRARRHYGPSRQRTGLGSLAQKQGRAGRAW